MAEDGLWGEYHIFHQVRCLADLAVDSGDDGGRWAVGKRVETDQGRPDGRKLVKGLGKEELACRVFGELKQATRQVVADGVAQDVVLGLFRRQVSALLGRDKHELALDDGQRRHFREEKNRRRRSPLTS